MSKIAVIDIETTGLDFKKDYIVEIGIVELDLLSGEIKPLYDKLVKEEGFHEGLTEAWVFQNTDLTIEEVMKADPLEFDVLQKIFQMYEATAYNKKFDIGFLTARGIRINELPCPMLLSTDICRIPRHGSFGYKWPKVQEAWEHFFGKNTGYIEKHRGFDDALHEAKIILELFRRGTFQYRGLTPTREEPKNEDTR